MIDLKSSIDQKNIHKTCLLTSENICQNKLKPLIVFFINEFSTCYINNNLYVISFIYNRLRSITIEYGKYSKHMGKSRILRIAICELFVLLTQHKQNIMEYRSTKIKIDKQSISHVHIAMDSFITLYDSNANSSSTTKIIPLNQYLQHLKQFYYSDDECDKIIVELLYYISVKNHAKVLYFVNCFLNQIKTKISTKLLDEPEFDDLTKENLLFFNNQSKEDNIWILFYIANQHALNDHKLWIKKLTYIFAQCYTKSCKNNRFNILIMVYTIMLSNDLNHFYINRNVYNKIMFQCIFKIDYIYRELDQKYHLNIFENKNDKHESKCKPISNVKQENPQERSMYEQLLYSCPTKNIQIIDYITKIKQDILQKNIHETKVVEITSQ